MSHLSSVTSSAATANRADAGLAGRMLNKVPAVTVFFWIIKVLCTTVGETAADFLNANLHLGLSGTTAVMGVLLVVALVIQFRARAYIAWVYWLVVVLLSVFGTLITDNLSDQLHVPLQVSTIVFSAALAVTFAIWYARERTLSIHSIYTTRRESFYWLAILFTFALGTAGGDLIAEQYKVGYLPALGIFAAAIAVIAAAHLLFRLNGILTFWLAYILTRPLGASLGDYLSQPRSEGGLGLSTAIVNSVFLTLIVALIVYLSRTRVDVLPPDATTETS